MQVSGRAARVLSYLLADNQHCKQVLLGQENFQSLNATHNQAGLLPFIVDGICAMSTHVAESDASNGRERSRAGLLVYH